MTAGEYDIHTARRPAAAAGDAGARSSDQPDATPCAGPECSERGGVSVECIPTWTDADLAQATSAVAPAWVARNSLWRGLWLGWQFLRQVSGDDAYERYLEHLARFHPGQTPMTRAEHFRFSQEQKWNGVSRCC